LILLALLGSKLNVGVVLSAKILFVQVTELDQMMQNILTPIVKLVKLNTSAVNSIL
jgi:hypothetical protein